MPPRPFILRSGTTEPGPTCWHGSPNVCGPVQPGLRARLDYLTLLARSRRHPALVPFLACPVPPAPEHELAEFARFTARLADLGQCASCFIPDGGPDAVEDPADADTGSRPSRCSAWESRCAVPS